MIPFFDLGAEYRELKPEIDAAVSRVLESGQYVGGSEITALEEEFASYCGTRSGCQFRDQRAPFGVGRRGDRPGR